ncbi:MAG: SpoVG family protein [Candidatus Omnitrophica bacterium]|nr:SpoVG family protein [Candidatus Omnitrophota bacterium]
MGTKPVVQVERIHKLTTDGATKAFCDICLLDTFIVKGLRVVQGKEGLFLSMPREQGRDGKWYETFFPKEKNIRKELEQIVLESYSEKAAEN